MKIKLKRVLKITIFFLVVFLISYSLLWTFEKPFNKAEWQANPYQRYKMVDDLIESRLLINKSKRDVITILGQPTSSANAQKNIFTYNIGEPPHFFDSRKEHLLIVFLEQKVDKVSLAYE